MRKRYDMMDVRQAADDSMRLRNIKLDLDNLDTMFHYQWDSLSQAEQIKLVYLRAKKFKQYRQLSRKMEGIFL